MNPCQSCCTASVQSPSPLSYLPYKMRTKPGSSGQEQKQPSLFHSPGNKGNTSHKSVRGGKTVPALCKGRELFFPSHSLLPAPLRTTTYLLPGNVLQGLGSEYLHNIWLMENATQELSFCDKADCKCYPQQAAQTKNFRMGCDSHACNDSPGNSAAFKHQHQIPDQD